MLGWPSILLRSSPVRRGFMLGCLDDRYMFGGVYMSVVVVSREVARDAEGVGVADP